MTRELLEAYHRAVGDFHFNALVEALTKSDNMILDEINKISAKIDRLLYKRPPSAEIFGEKR